MTNHPNRTRRIWQDGDIVYLRDGDEIVREFWVPAAGGYVRAVRPGQRGTLGKLVISHRTSDRLVLLSATPDSLIDVIRREYRVSRDRRESAV